MNKKVIPSEQTQQEAMKIALATQKPGQTKEQTKLISQGIEKGIALYKKQLKEKNRQADKAKKKMQKVKQATSDSVEHDDKAHVESTSLSFLIYLPWLLLVVSWGIFFWFINQ